MKYLVITAVLALVLAGVSFAGNVVMTEVLTGSNLTLTMPNNFSMSSWTLGGQASTAVGSIGGDQNYIVEDSRGSGAGWNLIVQISQFKTSGTPMRTLPPNNFSIFIAADMITKIWGQAIDATNGPKPLTQDTVPLVADVEFEAIHALSGYGMGKYNCSIANELVMPAETYAGTYTATLTATLNNAP